MTRPHRAVLIAGVIALCAPFAAVAGPQRSRTSRSLALDAAFGDRGVAEFTGAGARWLDQFDFIVADADGEHVYVAGSSPGPAIARFDKFGSPDAEFGTEGFAVLPV